MLLLAIVSNINIYLINLQKRGGWSKIQSSLLFYTKYINVYVIIFKIKHTVL